MDWSASRNPNITMERLKNIQIKRGIGTIYHKIRILRWK